MLGLVEDEASHFFSESEWSSGLAPSDRDRYLRTLVRNGYDFHLNEIFATVQNEYSDWGSFSSSDRRRARRRQLREASRALTDKLYLAPASQTAEWCQKRGFPTYFYVFGEGDRDDEARVG